MYVHGGAFTPGGRVCGATAVGTCGVGFAAADADEAEATRAATASIDGVLGGGGGRGGNIVPEAAAGCGGGDFTRYRHIG
jgi:hypothetical protein